MNGDFKMRVVPGRDKNNFKQVSKRGCVKGDFVQNWVPDQDKCAAKQLEDKFRVKGDFKQKDGVATVTEEDDGLDNMEEEGHLRE